MLTLDQEKNQSEKEETELLKIIESVDKDT